MTVTVHVYRLRNHKTWVAYKTYTTTNFTAANRKHRSYTQFRLGLAIGREGKYRFEATTSATAAWASGSSSCGWTLNVH